MTEVERGPFRRVAIVGLGLMGGSLAGALKRLPLPPHLRVLSLDPEEVRAGVAAGVVDEGTEDPSALLADRDLLVYATPLGSTLSLMGEHRPFLDPGTVVTDLVSLKVPVLARAAELGLENRYVGSHPMVGGTGTGFAHARPELYRDGRVWLVRGPGCGPAPMEDLAGFWETLGAFPAEISAQDHDESMAWVSHLPQLTSTALALALKEAGLTRDTLGSGGRDMTRLAGSAPGMWKDLLQAAPESLPGALESVEGWLGALRRKLLRRDAEGIAKDMTETRDWVEERP
jgi:prephenate dehydrogenase